VRLNLRERGWVEKFGPRMMCAAASVTHTTDKLLQCSTDEGSLSVCLSLSLHLQTN